ncbi:hypothetical protein LTR08_001842 [Meristemomyces frigidus]|nr:hypothetical protein LTR08_001842 [Meristemomyces frigidus]
MKGAGYGWDDWVILGCLPLCLAGDILLDQTTRHGLGKDIWVLQPKDITEVVFLFWVQEFIYLTLMSGTKISVVLLYLRIFPSTVSTWFRRTCFLVIGLIACYWISMCISTAVECTPVSYAWTSWDGEHKGHCINTVAQIYGGASFNIVFDVIVFFLPIPKLLQLEVATSRKKIGIILTFLVGLFVTICSIIRLQYLVRWGKSTNPTWDYTPIGIWSVIEGNAATICSCMPAMAGPLKKLWMHVQNSITNSFHTSSSSKLSGKSSRTQGASGNRSFRGRKLSDGDVEFSSGAQDTPGLGGISKTQAISTEYYLRTQSSGANDEVELVDKAYVTKDYRAEHAYAKEWRPC